jgi:hypothetical protein
MNTTKIECEITGASIIDTYNRPTFQQRLNDWVVSTFGQDNADNIVERNNRFGEEALELLQSTGMSREAVLDMVDYVYDRDIGEPEQEVGGVMTTLAALCTANGIDMDHAKEKEFARTISKTDVIKEKNLTKPTFT